VDDFKACTQDIITAWDLSAPVKYRPETRRGLMKTAKRRARRKLRQEDKIWYSEQEAMKKMSVTDEELIDS